MLQPFLHSSHGFFHGLQFDGKEKVEYTSDDKSRSGNVNYTDGAGAGIIKDKTSEYRGKDTPE